MKNKKRGPLFFIHDHSFSDEGTAYFDFIEAHKLNPLHVFWVTSTYGSALAEATMNNHSGRESYALTTDPAFAKEMADVVMIALEREMEPIFIYKKPNKKTK